ncbi:MAG: carbamoyltransferase HypF [Xanthobacteraceae bacterium]
MALARTAAGHDRPQRLRLRVRGAVQGVGFRPFAHGLATTLDLAGFVRNGPDGVVVEVEGARAGEFAGLLRKAAPPLARIEEIEVEPLALHGDAGFTIAPSEVGLARTRIVPDTAVCEACLDDLFDSKSRFYLYPFVTCTHCGPRFTLTHRLPYDRPQTSMAPFAMCAACARDYADPTNRRFHAEPIACPLCGPRLSHPVELIVAAIRAGDIVALKGIGGFHLMCDAANEMAVAELRRRKAREAKPFAVMVANVASVDRIAAPSEAERALLTAPARPIVLMESRHALVPSIAPGLTRIGVMLPYAPLHHLIFHAAAGSPAGSVARNAVHDLVLVATSANPGGEPLVISDDEAKDKLKDIADLIVTHDRAIVTRADDSVMAVVVGAPTFLRRARGFVPEPVDLGSDGPKVLAVGAHLKATVTVTRGREAFVSQHIGSLDNAATVRFHAETVRHLLDILDVAPEAVACDLHPDFQSTRFAENLGPPVVPVQHHAAHIAAIAAEHGIAGPVLGVALDGHGLGDDGGAWGGEVMLVGDGTWHRLGHLAPLALPGGDRAARSPWRMGVAALQALDQLDRVAELFADLPEAQKLAGLMRAGLDLPTTASAGRLFDAAAALLGVCLDQRYEAQAAAELEALVDTPRVLAGGWRIESGVLDFRPLLAALAAPGLSAREGAEIFHGTLAAGIADWIAMFARAEGHASIALGGGCLMNRVLAEDLCARLRARSLEPLLARAVPPNDGGLSLGQAFLARQILTASKRIIDHVPRNSGESH